MKHQVQVSLVTDLVFEYEIDDHFDPDGHEAGLAKIKAHDDAHDRAENVLNIIGLTLDLANITYMTTITNSKNIQVSDEE